MLYHCGWIDVTEADSIGKVSFSICLTTLADSRLFVGRLLIESSLVSGATLLHLDMAGVASRRRPGLDTSGMPNISGKMWISG